MKNISNDSIFYCLNCGQRGIPIIRKESKQRSTGHFKKLWCPHCRLVVNHIELKTPYDIEVFKEEFAAGAYTELAKESIEICKGD